MEGYYLNYTPIADYCVLSVLLVFYFVIRSSFYVNSSKNKWMRLGLITLFIATMFNVSYMNLIIVSGLKFKVAIYVLRDIANIMLLICLGIFVKYLSSVFETNKYFLQYLDLFNVIFISILGFLTVFGPALKFGFYIENGSIVHGSFFKDPYAIGYIFYLLALTIQLIRYKKSLLSKAFNAILSCYILTEVIMLFEAIKGSSTFVCFTYVIPLLAVFVLFHSSSYDLDTGTLDSKAFNDYVNELILKNKKFGVMYLNFVGNKEMDPFLNAIHDELHHFYDKYFVKGYTFRISERKFILVFSSIKGIDDPTVFFNKFKKSFNELYKKYNMNFKLVSMYSNSLLGSSGIYNNFLKFIEKKVPNNGFYAVCDKDIIEFFDVSKTLELLKNIDYCKNLNDDRVLVYTQPIFDTKHKCIKSAESLMRLKDGENIIYPDKFIKLAEENNLIHHLSLTILNKVCKNISKLMRSGYSIDRISVNFSTIELSLPSFTDDIINIVSKNKIPFDKIGIEITESQAVGLSDEVLEKVNVLSEAGMKIYLDDFGTGYSNLERIMKLPFDIIKFDKSLLDNSNVDAKFKLMTKNLSQTYNDLGYTILFEGVETEKDSKLCSDEMNATYLQGYFYSKPLPIEKLTSFLNKK